MARRKQTSKSSSKRRLSGSQIVLAVLSLIIVLSMAIGFVISVLPTPGEQQSVATSTPVILATSTLTPTLEPSPTPSATIEAPLPAGPATAPSDQ
jgi:hypothetical protein